uniref:Ig-like domain-containing protein n=1 Tax=Gasterosteus aculeatus aculeatus TaxID=481459 RepID=A0AAQ4QJ37_GASAC
MRTVNLETDRYGTLSSLHLGPPRSSCGPTPNFRPPPLVLLLRPLNRFSVSSVCEPCKHCRRDFHILDQCARQRTRVCVCVCSRARAFCSAAPPGVRCGDSLLESEEFYWIDRQRRERTGVTPHGTKKTRGDIKEKYEIKGGMKMDISVVTLVFGLLMFDSSQECDYYVASGRKATLPMTFALDQSDELTWMHGMKTILRQTKDKFTSEGKNIVTANGSLTWANVAQSNAGPYKAEVHDRDGKSRWASKSTRLCVIDPVPKPTVTHECNQTEVKFTCDVQPKAEGFDFEWLQDNQVLDTEKGQTLTRPGDQVTGPITCKLTNRVSSETSEEVHQTCYSEFYQGKLFGIETWIVVATGGGVVLLLIIGVIVCCVCSKRKKRLHLEEEEERRL